MKEISVFLCPDFLKKDMSFIADFLNKMMPNFNILVKKCSVIGPKQKHLREHRI